MVKRIKKKGKRFIRGHQIVKGTRGSAAHFITRNTAIRRLQVPLSEFRKLCILKGIYPRQPKRFFKGANKTYYLKKDIIFIQHDPLMKKIAERRVWRKRLKKVKAKKMKFDEALVRKDKPFYTLNHIVKERYPTFVDALRDLDDALSLIFLFSEMPSNEKISAKRVANCKKLIAEFQYYIIRTHSLRKVFVSIKGIYYQAEIRGITITWLVPYRFTPTIAKNIDYKVLLTFLEFYETLVGFINFKLYNSIGLNYPPKFSVSMKSKGDLLEAIASINQEVQQQHVVPAPVEQVKIEDEPKLTEEDKVRLATLKEALEKFKGNEESTEESIDEGGPDSDEEEAKNDKNIIVDEKEKENDDAIFESDELSKQRKIQDDFENMFAKCHFWLSREVPKESLEFVIKSFGGKVSWDGNGNESDDSITHHVIDRNNLLSQQVVSRDYIQPQWVYDCINVRVLIPTNEYGPGCKLPPHLSPFVDDYAEGYVPDYRKKLEEYQHQKLGGPVLNTATEQAEESESDEEERFAEDLAAEKEGKYDTVSQKKKKIDKKDFEEAEQKETSLALISSRRRTILRQINYSKRRKQKTIDLLEMKRKKLKDGTATVVDKTAIVYKNENENK